MRGGWPFDGRGLRRAKPLQGRRDTGVWFLRLLRLFAAIPLPGDRRYRRRERPRADGLRGDGGLATMSSVRQGFIDAGDERLGHADATTHPFGKWLDGLAPPLLLHQPLHLLAAPMPPLAASQLARELADEILMLLLPRDALHVSVFRLHRENFNGLRDVERGQFH